MDGNKNWRDRIHKKANNRYINTRVSKEEYDWVKAEAKRAKVTSGQIIRAIIQDLKSKDHL